MIGSMTRGEGPRQGLVAKLVNITSIIRLKGNTSKTGPVEIPSGRFARFAPQERRTGNRLNLPVNELEIGPRDLALHRPVLWMAF